MSLENITVNPEDTYAFGRKLFRDFVHFCSFHFILNRKGSRSTEVAGLKLMVGPSVFHPKVFLTSRFFAEFLQKQNLHGKRVVEVGTGSGILSLSAAKAGAEYVLALDINPEAVKTAATNATINNLPQLEARESNLFSAVPETDKFDIIISSPPSFSGEPRNVADRAWFAGPGYRDILPLFDQAEARLKPDGIMYLLVSSDTNIALFDQLIARAGLDSKHVATQSIFVEKFYLYELRRRSEMALAAG